MGVIGSLSRGIGALKRNPMIVAIVFAYSLFSTGLVALQAIDPWLVLAGYLVLLVVAPFYVGGLIGAIRNGLAGTTSVGRFLRAGKSNYLSLLGGGFVLGVVTFVLYFVVGIVGFILAIFVLGAGSIAGVTSASVAVLVVGALVGLLIVLLPWFFLQFFPAAVVVDDLGLVDSFKRSGGLVKDNFLSVVGFDVLTFLISIVAQIPTVYLAAVQETSPTDIESAQHSIFETLSTTELGIYLGMTLVLGTIVGAITQAFYVAFHDQLPR